MWDYGSDTYDGEFEVLFPDLTVNRDPACKWWMTQIMVPLIQKAQCVNLYESYGTQLKES